ncbi:MAG: hypothetical protein LBU91_07315 [Bacteroidales bacterium]|jgi:hypothetical protein|nr:hypothetical protein [Bacteroidales bacterium]
MKVNIKFATLSAALLIMLGLFANTVHAQHFPWELPVKPGMWDYPVKPGMDEWKKFKTNQEMVSACQVPEEVLTSLSTEDLTDLVLRYPLLWDFRAFNNPNHGLDKLFRDFNGIRELYKREDVADCLIQRYNDLFQSLPLLDNPPPGFRIGSLTSFISVLESLLSRVEKQESNEENLKGVLQTLVAGYEKKLEYPDYFQGDGLRTNFYSRAHIIVKIEPSILEQAKMKQKQAKSSTMSVEENVNLINEWSYQLIK